MATTADFRNGLCIEYNHDIYAIVEFQHVKPGKGPAFVRTKLKSIRNGKVLDNTFSAGHKVTTARIERRPHQFLYKDDIGYNFMDSSTFEQIAIQESFISEPLFLKDGLEVDILFHAEEEKVLSCELPQTVEMTIVYTEPGVKGDTATNATKPATTETGAIVQVPLFIGQDEKIRVNTETKTYVERVK
jgi:elongation factor P